MAYLCENIKLLSHNKKKESGAFISVIEWPRIPAYLPKQLEKDFGNAAYATIRGFVMKFEKYGLLISKKYSNRIKYQVKK